MLWLVRQGALSNSVNKFTNPAKTGRTSPRPVVKPIALRRIKVSHPFAAGLFARVPAEHYPSCRTN